MAFERESFLRRRWCSATRRSRRPPSTSSPGRPSGPASTSSTRATPSTAQSCKEDSSQTIIAILVRVHILYNYVSCFVHFTLENLFSKVNFCINEAFRGFLDARSNLEEIEIERSVHPLRSSRSVNPILTNGTSFSFLFFP